MGRSFRAQVSDPDFPLRQFAPEVAGKLRQLEKSWEMIQNPMSETEAEAILRQAFPDEPGTGSAKIQRHKTQRGEAANRGGARTRMSDKNVRAPVPSGKSSQPEKTLDRL